MIFKTKAEEKYNGRNNFEVWINKFEDYANLGQWSEDEKSLLLFRSLNRGARVYFVRLPEQKNKLYHARV